MGKKHDIETNVALGVEIITFEDKTYEEIKQIAKDNNEKRLAELKEK